MTVGGVRRGTDQRRRGRWQPECGASGDHRAAALAGLPATPGWAPRALPTQCPPIGAKIKIPLQFDTGAAARPGDNILVRRSGILSPSNGVVCTNG